MSEWVSADKQKPHLGVWVLGYINGNNSTGFDVVYFHNGFWFTQDYQVPVTHWQPLPKPPTEL